MPPKSTSNYFDFINDVRRGTTSNAGKVFVPDNSKLSGDTFYHKSASWYDTGFTWYELLARPWYSAPGVASQDTYWNKMMENQGKYNIGFVTAYDAAAAAKKIAQEPTNGYV